MHVARFANGPTRTCASRGADQQVLGADDGIRTRDPNLGKVVLYQLSYVRVGSAPYQAAGRGSPLRKGDKGREHTRRSAVYRDAGHDLAGDRCLTSE